MPTVVVGRDQTIRAEFLKIGGTDMRAFARHCMTIGIFTFEERDELELRAVAGICKRALKKPDDDGLPMAGQTTFVSDEGAPIWQQRHLWIFEDYQLNYADAMGQADVLMDTAERLADECEGRFGRRPARP